MFLSMLENIRRGFTEISRVLKKGGYHVFTIPFNFDKNTVTMVEITDDEDIPIFPPEYHESKRGKILTYRTFGIDLFKLLDSIGFDTKVDFSSYSDHKYRIYNSFVFISKKI